MCIAIVKPKGIKIPKKNLENAMSSNGDGCGIAYFDGALKFAKGLWTFDEFYKLYETVEEHTMLIHFRIATHGGVSEKNCHPFIFGDGKYAMIHNGVLNIKTDKEKNEVDSEVFARLVLGRLVRHVKITNPALHFLIESSIGTNKIAVLNNRGHYVIFNEKGGDWDDGVWYSNSSYKYSWKRGNYKCIGYNSNIDDDNDYGAYGGNGAYGAYGNTIKFCDNCKREITKEIKKCEEKGHCIYCKGAYIKKEETPANEIHCVNCFQRLTDVIKWCKDDGKCFFCKQPYEEQTDSKVHQETPPTKEENNGSV